MSSPNQPRAGKTGFGGGKGRGAPLSAWWPATKGGGQPRAASRAPSGGRLAKGGQPAGKGNGGAPSTHMAFKGQRHWIGIHGNARLRYNTWLDKGKHAVVANQQMIDAQDSKTADAVAQAKHAAEAAEAYSVACLQSMPTKSIKVGATTGVGIRGDWSDLPMPESRAPSHPASSSGAASSGAAATVKVETPEMGVDGAGPGGKSVGQPWQRWCSCGE